MEDMRTLYKLIILYMLNKVEFPLSNSQISEFILEKEYTNYFTLQQVLAECSESDLIHEITTYQQTSYHLTEVGQETIDFFHPDIPSSIKEDIVSYLSSKKYDLKNSTAIVSDYYRNDNSEYSVNLQVKENNIKLIDLTISVPTENVAETIANNWVQKNQEVYALIMQHLLKL